MLDLLIVLAFVAASVTAGLRARAKASENLEEYFLAGRSIRGWQAGLSMAATQYAADTPLLFAGLVASGGLYLVWRLWIYGLAFLLLAFVLARMWHRSGVLTDAELVEIRYSGGGVSTLRGLKAIYFGTVINCTVLAMVLVAATRICEIFLPWHVWLPSGLHERLVGLVRAVGVPLTSGVTGLDPWVATADNLLSIVAILAFVALYSTTGGLRGVIVTDLGQFGLAMVATALYAWFAVREAGGLAGLPATLSELYGSARATRMLWLVPPGAEALAPFLTIVGLQWFFQMNSDGTGYLAQRTMACRSEADARRAGVVFTWAQIVARSLLWLPIGVALLVVYPATGTAGSEGFTAERELLFVTGIRDLLPAGVRGLMLTGLLAALASTIDTHLNWGASYWSNDLYRGLLCRRLLRRRAGPRELVLVARLSNLVILTLALAIMAQLESIRAAWQISLLFGAGIGSVLVLRWLWERINLQAEMAAIVASLAMAPLLLWRVEGEAAKLALMAAASTAAVLAATWLTPPTTPEVLDAFYRRVRPVGWWTASARRVGDDPRRPLRELGAGLWRMAVTAGSVYLVLAGACRLMFPLPEGTRLGGAAMLVAGAAVLVADAAVGTFSKPREWGQESRPDG